MWRNHRVIENPRQQKPVSVADRIERPSANRHCTWKLNDIFIWKKKVEGAWRKEFHHDNADNSNTGSMPLVLDKEQAVEEEEKA